MKLLYAVGFLTLCFSTSWSMFVLVEVVEQLPVRAERQIQIQGEATRAAASLQLGAAVQQIALLRRDVTALANTALTGTDKRAESLQVNVLARVDAAVERLDAQATAARGSIDRSSVAIDRQLTTANESLARVALTAEPIRSSAQQISDALPLWLDCDHNADCAFNRYVGTARGIEKASLAVGESAPGITSSADRIAGDVAHVADRLTAKKRWYQHLTDVVWTAAGISRLAY